LLLPGGKGFRDSPLLFLSSSGIASPSVRFLPIIGARNENAFFSPFYERPSELQVRGLATLVASGFWRTMSIMLPKLRSGLAESFVGVYAVCMGQTLLDRAADALRKANEMLDEAVAAEKGQKTDLARTCRLRREAALREALGHLHAVTGTVEGELLLASAELKRNGPSARG